MIYWKVKNKTYTKFMIDSGKTTHSAELPCEHTTLVVLVKI